MKASFFESMRYVSPQKMPAQWPLPPGFYDPEVGVQTFQSTIERLAVCRGAWLRLGKLFRAPLRCQDSHPIAHRDGGAHGGASAQC